MRLEGSGDMREALGLLGIELADSQAPKGLA
jgi:hypothetical protein